MSAFSFADSYRAAGLNPGPDILRLREEPFDKLGNTIDVHHLVYLTRLYFELPTPEGTTWFEETFRETDPSFSFIDNQREIVVLAALLLEKTIQNLNFFAALCVLCAAAGGARQQKIDSSLLDRCVHAIEEKGQKEREHQPIGSKLFPPCPKSKISSDLVAFTAELQGGPEKIAAALKQISDETCTTLNNTINCANEIISPLEKEVINLREQVAMLWWHIGGWSRLLKRPFSEFTPSSAAILAGIDLADLSSSVAGPIAAPAIIQRTIATHIESNSTELPIQESINEFSEDDIKLLEINISLTSIPDICPVLTALVKARDIGNGTAWHRPFTKATGLSPTIAFKPLGLAMQVYRERLLTKAFQDNSNG